MSAYHADLPNVRFLTIIPCYVCTGRPAAVKRGLQRGKVVPSGVELFLSEGQEICKLPKQI